MIMMDHGVLSNFAEQILGLLGLTGRVLGYTAHQKKVFAQVYFGIPKFK
jgi:hypothetical protein